MVNIHKALIVDLLQYSRKEYIYHKNNSKDYPNKKELIDFYGKECLKYREKLEKIK